MNYADGPGSMFTFVPFIVMLGFVLVLGVIIVASVKGLTQWNKNNKSPVLTVDAKIVAKRMAVSRHMQQQAGDMNSQYMSSSTTYYVTFEVESRDRIELVVPDNEYGMLVEDDIGKLSFQGTRYKAFMRNR